MKTQNQKTMIKDLRLLSFALWFYVFSFSVFIYFPHSTCLAVTSKVTHHSSGADFLKGKVKNVRKLKDLANNKEIIDIISILGLDIDKHNTPKYDKIIIAADQDFDGYHIENLIVNFFYRWFPSVIEDGHLFSLVTPIIACDYNKKRKYFYTLTDYNKFKDLHKLSNIAYLKGLGSLSIDDWKYIMNNMVLIKIKSDTKAKRYLDIAFGENSNKRKLWLEGKL